MSLPALVDAAKKAIESIHSNPDANIESKLDCLGDLLEDIDTRISALNADLDRIFDDEDDEEIAEDAHHREAEDSLD